MPRILAQLKKPFQNRISKLTPNNDGQQIRLTIPPLTEERRRDLTKLVSKRGEEARIAVRNVRRDAIHDLREMENESMISEDDLRQGEEKVQEKTDAFIKQVDHIIREKDEEIMTVLRATRSVVGAVASHPYLPDLLRRMPELPEK